MSGPFGASQWMYATDSGFYPFEISNSLRFNTASSTYLEKDSYTHNRQTFTYSFWFKPTNTTTRQFIFGRYSDGNNVSVLEYDGGSNGQLSWYDYQSGSYTFQQRTTALFRDVSAWYHVVLRVDTTDGTAGSRARMYVNGTQQTDFTASTTVSQNVSFLLGDGGNDFRWGTEGSNNRLHFGGYLADIIVIDGSSLPPTSFAETKNDIWIPKSNIPSSDSYGTNGYRLQFKQTGTGQDSSGIGADTGGNDVHFSVSGLAAEDSVLDSPTNNFCTPNGNDNMNWLSQGLNRVTRTEGNLQMSGDSWITKSTFGMLTGKWYWEVRLEGGAVTAGIHLIDGLQDTHHAYYYYGYTANNVYKYAGNATLFDGSSVSANSILGVAFDADNLTLQYFIANSSIHTVSDVDAGKYSPSFGTAASSTLQVNFGQDSSFAGNETAQGNKDENGIGDFYYAPPSGFLALCTANLPAPVATVDPAQGGSPQDYFNTVLYTGDGNTTQAVTGVGFSPDWLWTKSRSTTDNHHIFDSVRVESGVMQRLFANLSVDEDGNFGSINSFDSDGFTTGNNTGTNNNNTTYAAWNWKAGTAFSNDASSTSVGSIDSAGSVNSDVGFSIINFTGTGSALTVAHGLSQAPELIIEKSREKDDYWAVYAAPIGNTHGLILNSTNATIDSDTYWNDTSPTSTVWTMGTQNAVNNSGEETIAYCFHSVDGYSKIGTYTGNGNADGAFAYTGFRPAWVIIKSVTSETGWRIYDSKRLGFNVTNNALYSNDTGAEDAANDHIDLLSNGFKMRRNNVSNTNGVKYLYMAFAEQPFKYANAR